MARHQANRTVFALSLNSLIYWFSYDNHSTAMLKSHEAVFAPLSLQLQNSTFSYSFAHPDDCASGILFLYLLITYWSCFVQCYNIIVEVTTSLRWDNSVSWGSVTIGDLMFQVPIFILNNGAWVCDYFYKPQSLLIGLIILLASTLFMVWCWQYSTQT